MFPYLLVTIGSGVSVLKVLLYVPIPPRNNRIRSISTKVIIIIIYIINTIIQPTVKASSPAESMLR